MKNLLILLLLSTSFSTFADSHLDFSLSDFCYLQPGVQDRGDVYYSPNEEVGISATSICVYKDAYGQYQSKGKLKKGKFDGKWTEWNQNGKIKIERRYINGQKRFEKNYKDGKEDGKWTRWHENGQIEQEGNYKDGILIAETIYTYHENGQIELEANYKDGELVGKVIGWYENGQKEWEENYKYDVLNSSTIWYENGQKKSEENWIDWISQNGKKTEWDENGQIISQKEYKEGECVSGDCPD